jgi:sugar phosphate isomerase/epimerase
MRLGGPVFLEKLDPESWVEEHRRWGYSAAYFPSVDTESDAMDYVRTARAADLLIAEVGVWNNPLSPFQTEREEAVRTCQEKLALADRIGAACCVNVSGSRGQKWDGPHPDNLTEVTFDMIIETVREIIDAVRPTRTFYTLETMPWMYPDSVESYNYLLAAVDRTAFAVHFDPANLLSSPQRYYNNAKVIREFISTLGEYIKSVHVKDVHIEETLTTHLNEVRPGLGEMNYHVLLQMLDSLGPDIPIMLEHLPDAEEYRHAVTYVRTAASEVNVSIKKPL